MAMPINIKNLINFRVMESNRVEFISGWNPTPIIHSICHLQTTSIMSAAVTS